MATFNWKPLEKYSPFAQLLATYMWDQRPPLNPAQLSRRLKIDYTAVYRWFMPKAKPDPSHLLIIAQYTPLSIQTLFIAAGYGLETYPLFSRSEAWRQVIDVVNDESTISAEEKQNILRVLTRLSPNAPVEVLSLPLYSEAHDTEISDVRYPTRERGGLQESESDHSQS